MKLLMENWRKYLKENVYSDLLHSFIQYSYELDELVEDWKVRLDRDYPYDEPDQISGIVLREKLQMLQNFLKTNNFERLGSGMERDAYMSPSGEVIKIANSTSYIPSNKQEIEKFNRQDIDAFPRVEAYDDRDYMWFVVEKVSQIGREDSWEKYKKLFPKLFSLIEEFWGQLGYKIPPPNEPWWAATYIVIELMKFLYQPKNPYGDGQMDSIDQLAKIVFRINSNYEDFTSTHRRAVDSLVRYLKDPDPNFSKLSRAVIDANVEPSDFHYNNLGYDKNWNIKILDAAN